MIEMIIPYKSVNTILRIKNKNNSITCNIQSVLCVQKLI